ncbi:MAG: phosphoglycolate phosphatase [Hyphomonadaceae bacterium]
MDHDFCNVDGARRLKQRIEEYWRERGYAVEVKLIEAGFVAAMRSARTDVRSDMVNGMPSRKSEQENERANPRLRGLMEVA